MTTSRTEILHIKKYPNRRYYDATRSKHITLQQVYNLIQSGRDVIITDSKTGENITNLVLVQVLLEKDQPKLDLFPTWVLLQFIRTNRQGVRRLMDQFFGPFLQMMAQSQRQYDEFLRSTMGTTVAQPTDWMNRMMSAFSGGMPPNTDAAETDDELDDAPPPPDDEPNQSRGDVDDLRAQLDELRRQVESLRTPPGKRQDPDRGNGPAAG